ncbi:MAG TPA: threonine ammonia-lyase [Bryobacteraceae bacterium]|jgi:threonine dehydratase
MITIADIRAARERCGESIRLTPAPYSETLSREAGNVLYLKLDNMNVTGCFKERGALNRLLLLSAEERARGVITASAGNHAQAVAYHASRIGVSAEICMPIYTPLVKVTATRGWGAKVILYGNNFDEALEEARRRERDEKRVFVHAFDDDAVIAGQGVIGLELLEQIPDLEAVVVPVGGGGLIGGIACALKESKPESRPGVRVIGVQTAALPSMQAALNAHRPVLLPPAPTIADGIAVRQTGERTLALNEKYVDEMVTVDDEEIAAAILRLLERQKVLAEGAGAAGVAAVLQRKTSLQGKKIAVVIGGGNIDVTLLSRIIERGLVKDGRLVRVRIPVPDHPGALQHLTAVIATEHANIVQVVHDRAYFGAHLGEGVVDITMETRGPEHVEELTRKLRAAGYPLEQVR